METQTPPDNFIRTKLSLIIMSILASSLISGSLAYAYKHQKNNKTNNDLQAQIDSLSKQISTAKKSLATPSPTSSPTPDLKNQINGFADMAKGIAFEYPIDWKVGTNTETETSDLVTLYSPAMTKALNAHAEGGPSFAFNYYSSAKDLIDDQSKPSNAASLADYLKKYTGASPILSYTPKKIGSYDGYSAEQPNIGGIGFYYIEQNGHVYQFTYNQAEQTDIDTILTNLALIQTNTFSDTTTYSTKIKTYTINYPSTWQAAKSTDQPGYSTVNFSLNNIKYGLTFALGSKEFGSTNVTTSTVTYGGKEFKRSVEKNNGLITTVAYSPIDTTNSPFEGVIGNLPSEHTSLYLAEFDAIIASLTFKN